VRAHEDGAGELKDGACEEEEEGGGRRRRRRRREEVV
jgi:hypothetical protein